MADTKKAAAQRNRNSSSLSKAASIDISKTLGSLSSTGLNIQSSLAKIQEEMIQKHAELQAVDEAIKLKKQDLQDLHGVDQALLTLDETKALHSQFVDEAAKQKAQIDTQHLELLKAQEVARQRADADYNYNLGLRRKEEQDNYAETIRVRNNQERDRKEAFEKDITVRQEALQAQETEYRAALEKAKNFEAEVEKAAKQQVAIVTNTLTKDFNHKQELVAMQNATTIAKIEHDNKRLVEAANNYENQVKELQSQLKEAYKANSDLAAKAVESASNAKSVADMQSLITNVGGNGTRART